MLYPVDLVSLLIRMAPGAFGSALSVFWGQRSQPTLRKLVLFVSGTLFSVFASPEIAKLPGFHLQDGFLLGFMVGLCSMALCGKIYATVANFNVSSILRDYARKTLGLPTVTTGPAAFKD